MDVEALIQDPVAWVVAAAVLLVLLIVIVALVVRRRRRRQAQFRNRYGAEYERTVSESRSRREAERDLDARDERHSHLRLRPIGADGRDRFRARFEATQASFVDAPEVALRTADGIIDEVAIARGYDDDTDRNTRLSDVSVDHPENVAVHRRGMKILDRDEGPSTEDLRQAFLSARRLFEEMVSVGEEEEPPAAEPPGMARERRSEPEQAGPDLDEPAGGRAAAAGGSDPDTVGRDGDSAGAMPRDDEERGPAPRAEDRDRPRDVDDEHSTIFLPDGTPATRE